MAFRAPAAFRSVLARPVNSLTKPAARYASTSAEAPAQSFNKHMPVEVYPVVAVVVIGVVGAGWYLTRLIRHPDVILSRHTNPEPWNRVEQGTNTKLMAVNQKFEKTYKRDAL